MELNKEIPVVVVTHANHKTRMIIATSQIFTAYVGPDSSTHVLSVGGAIVPISEPLNEFENKLTLALSQGSINKQGET